MALPISSSALSFSCTSNPTSSTSSPSLTSSFTNSTFFSKTLSRRNRTNRSPTLFRTRTRGLSCNCLFGLGVPELVVIAGVVALVFGPSKLPEVGRSIGKTVKSFQQAAKEFETELKEEPDSSAIEAPLEKPTASVADEVVEVPGNRESS